MKTPARSRRDAFVRASAALALALAAACSDRGNPVAAPPAGPAPAQPVLVAGVRCRADVAHRAVSCDEASLPASLRGYVVVGGQHKYVTLTSSNVAYAGTDFSFDVTVQNLIAQPMGTTNGVTPDPNGVRVIFAGEPAATSGTGTITVSNADGLGTFTATNQPYFAYTGPGDLGADGVLGQNETTAAHTWHLDVPNSVGSFGFTIYVVTEVQFPQGWIDLAGAAHQLSATTQGVAARVRTFAGDSAADQTVTWGTSSASVATVGPDGTVTAVAPGTATITATQGARTGSFVVSVCPNLAVGGVYVAGADAASICLAGGASGKAEYTYIPINLSQTTSLASFSVTGGAGVDSALVRPLSPNPDRVPLSGPLALRLPSQGFEPGSDLPILLRDLPRMNALMRNPASRIVRSRRGGPRYTITQGVVPAVGDSMDLNTNAACSGSPSIRRGVVRSVGKHLIAMSDTANPAGGFTTAQYDSIVAEFDTLSWPVDSTNFGAPTDHDGNGHVIAFFTRAVNELTPPPDPNPYPAVLGFFAPKDVFNADPVDGCTNTNLGEIFYMLVPDPTGSVNSNQRLVSDVRKTTTGTMAHEFQHMINGWRRAYVTGASYFEEGFLNEGLSHIAEELMFYKASGMSPRVNIQLGTNAVSGIQLNTKRVSAFNAYANPNFGRFKGWISRPDTAGAFTRNQNSLAVRGAIWAFLRYAVDRVNGNDQAFWYTLVNSNRQGLDNIQNAIGTDPNPWLRDFVTAMYVDDNATITVASQYKTPSWNYRSMYSALGGFSLQTQRLYTGATLGADYSAGGTAQYYRFAVASGAFGTVTTSALPATPFAVMVARTR
jgi:hypothetical protein